MANHRQVGKCQVCGRGPAMFASRALLSIVLQADCTSLAPTQHPFSVPSYLRGGPSLRAHQLALPYVEPADCAALSARRLSAGASARPVPLFFAGARADFDTEAGCPNVWNHSARVRSALLELSSHVPGAELRAFQVPDIVQ